MTSFKSQTKLPRRILPLGLLVAILSLTMLQLSPTAFASTMTIKQYDQTMQTVPTSGIGCFNATYPVETWVRVPCATDIPQLPATVGNGNDYVASISGSTNIGYVTTAFVSASGITGEVDSLNPCSGGAGTCTSWYSLQINSQTGFSCTVPTVGGTWTDCWEQFIFDNQGTTQGYLYIQYWLIGYLNSNAACPSTSWSTYGTSCFVNDSGALTGAITPTNTHLAALSYTAEADYSNSGNDYSSICNGSGSCWSQTASDTYLQLYQHWSASEFNILGYIGGSQAQFSPSTGVTLKPEQALESSGGSTLTPTTPCPNTGYTGETNNLNLQSGSCSVSGPSSILQFTEYN
jgi:hypothetical protein